MIVPPGVRRDLSIKVSNKFRPRPTSARRQARRFFSLFLRAQEISRPLGARFYPLLSFLPSPFLYLMGPAAFLAYKDVAEREVFVAPSFQLHAIVNFLDFTVNWRCL